MTHHDAFLADIIAHPDDDAPRLIYADWLEENGEPERAEFIRVQCALAAIEPMPKYDTLDELSVGENWLWALRRRDRKLLDAHAWGWAGEAIRDAATVGAHRKNAIGFRRGFVESIFLLCADWLTHGPAIVRAAPIREVRLTDKRPSQTYIRELHSRRYNRLRFAWFCQNVPLSGIVDENVDFDPNRFGLPTSLFSLVQGGEGSSLMARWFDAEIDACAALSQACIAYATPPS